MDFIKEWTFYVCITVIASVIFSFLTPKGSMGDFYKVIISIMIFLSFFYPVSTRGLSSLEYPKTEQNEYTNSNNTICFMIKQKINETLLKYDIVGADVRCEYELNDKNEIDIKNIQVAVSDEYEIDKVEEIIFDDLQLKVSVIHIGQ